MTVAAGSNLVQIPIAFCFAVAFSSGFSGMFQLFSPCIILFICIAVVDKNARQGPAPQLCLAPQEHSTNNPVLEM